MATKENSMNVNVNVKSVLNNELKEEHKSFSSLVQTLNGKKNSEAMKSYLNTFSLTFEQLTDINFLKTGLKYHTFKAANGKEYETICRKNKDGELVPAKWSFWLILTAAAKVRREQLKAAQKAQKMAEKEAKEKSLEAIEKEEKEAAKKQTKKAK